MPSAQLRYYFINTKMKQHRISASGDEAACARGPRSLHLLPPRGAGVLRSALRHGFADDFKPKTRRTNSLAADRPARCTQNPPSSPETPARPPLPDTDTVLTVAIIISFL